jgi:hypothetical protein
MLKEMRDAAGDSGEFYTPRAVVRFMVDVVDPRLGETVLDPACGTGGFLVEAYSHMEKQARRSPTASCKQAAISAASQAAAVPARQMNLLLHGLETPRSSPATASRHKLTEIGDKPTAWTSSSPTRPSAARRSAASRATSPRTSRPPRPRCSSSSSSCASCTARSRRAARAAVVVPNGTLFGDGVCARIKEELLKEFNLHTIVRLPNGVFAPYTAIPPTCSSSTAPARPLGTSGTTSSRCPKGARTTPRPTNARRQRLHPNDLLKSSVLAPSLERQRAIVAHVDAVQGAVREVQTIRTNVGSELDALLMSAYQRISEGAPRRPLGEVAPVVRREVSIDPEMNYTELGVRSFYKGTFQRRTVVGAEFSWQDLYWIKQGDLVFSNIMAWEKAIAVAKSEDADCVGNHRMLTCEAKGDCAVPSFLWYHFTTPDGFDKVHAASPGTAARNRTLTAKALQTIPVPVPAVERQQWFDRVFAEVDHARRLREAAAEEQRQLVPSLVQRLFAPGIERATAS